MSRLSWFSRALSWFAPRWSVRRKQARLVAQNYEAAGRGRRTSGWRGPSGDANSTSSMTLARLRDLARDLDRNNGWAKRGLKVLVTSVIGAGIENQVRLDGEPFPEGQTLWNTWAKTTAMDFDGQLNWLGTQALVFRTLVQSGGCLILRERAGSQDRLPLSAPVKIRVLEPDHLDDNTFQRQGGNWVEKGIELDERGRRVAYWLFLAHPGSTLRRTTQSVRVPAEDVIHIYAMDRPGQLRGVSWFHAAIATTKELDELEGARVMQSKVAALFGVFVNDVAGEGVGAVGPTEDATNSQGLPEKFESMEPGAVYYLQPGEDIRAAEPPRFDAAEQGFANHYLRKMAAGLGVTFEDLTGNYLEVNFSSARMARLVFAASVHTWQWHLMIPGFCERVFGWVMEIATVLEGWPGVPSATWTPPALPAVDEGKDATTKINRIRGGLDNHDEVLRGEGKNPDEHWDEYERRTKDLEQRGIIVDTDAGKVTRGGQFQFVQE